MTELIHEILGSTEEEYELKLARNHMMSGDGVPVSEEPRWHSHPVLGIKGHAHSSVKEARTPHTHRPEVQWDMTPVALPKEQ